MKTRTVDALKKWFQKKQRALPWRENRSPYAVWVSEVMLQQTQVNTVIPYYLNWMRLFPSIDTLANAPLEQIIKAWEGLGYYSRARNLHKGAQYLQQHHASQLPNNQEQLQKVPGIGDYTVGAIRAFAFHEKTAAVDTNVIRVITRLYGIDSDITKQSTKRQIRAAAEKLLPKNAPWIVAEALIELGATVCKKKPLCAQCPVNSCCYAYHNDRTDTLPTQRPRAKTTPLFRTVTLIHNSNNHWLVVKRSKGQIMQDLYEFPYLETGPEGLSHKDTAQKIQHALGLTCSPQESLPETSQAFTRYQVKLSPVILKTTAKITPTDGTWKTLAQMQELPFSSGHRRILLALARIYNRR